MISIPGKSGSTCDGFSRREFLRIGGAGMMGISLADILRLQARADTAPDGAKSKAGWGKAKSVILIFLQGGPSHIDIWDPKPDAPSNVRGEFKSIPTLIFLDEDFNELAVWIERPASVTKLREEKRQQLYKDNPAWGDPSKPIAELPEDVRTDVQAKSGAMRNETKPFANSEVVREFREIVQRIGSKLAV